MKVRYKKNEKEMKITIEGEGNQYHELDFGDGQQYYVSIHYGPMTNEKLYHDAKWLKEQYVKKDRTMKEIGNQCGVSPMTINMWLNRFGIETRSRGRR